MIIMRMQVYSDYKLLLIFMTFKQLGRNGIRLSDELGTKISRECKSLIAIGNIRHYAFVSEQQALLVCLCQVYATETVRGEQMGISPSFQSASGQQQSF
jgi:hypothetical protein